MKPTTTITLLSLAFAGLAACERAEIMRQDIKPATSPARQNDAPPAAEEGRDGEDAAPGEIRYASLLAGLVQDSCIGCHATKRDEAGNVTKSPKGGVDLSSAAALLNPASGKHVVTPGNAETSVLYQVVVSGEMPPRGELKPEQIALLKAWIDGGALD